MMKVLEYILKRGGEVQVTAIPAPPPHPDSIKDCFDKVFEHEVDNTNSIYKLVKMSLLEEDWATWNFMQWFVKEQTEEETLSMKLIDDIKIAGGEKMNTSALYSLDRDLGNASEEVKAAQDVTSDHP